MRHAVMMLCLTGCASLAGGHIDTYRCGYDTVWEETLRALEPATFAATDKRHGRIETEWEKGMADQTSGIMGRSDLVQERSSIVVSLARQRNNTEVRVIHVRQQRHLGGTRSLRWRHVPSSPEVENRMLARIHDRLKQRGCGPL
jgi:uncharacterized lipoprotein